MLSGLTPGATTILVVAIAASLLGLYASPKLIDKSLFRPYWFLRRREYSTAINSGFMHADLLHLIFNMMTLFFFGPKLEHAIGTVPFLVLYFVALLLSLVGTFIKHRNNPDYACLGASGAISGILFAAIVYYPGESLIIFPIPLPIPAPLFAIGYLAYSYYSAKHPTGRINHDAHLGGALTGLAFVALTDFGAYRELVARFL